MRAVKGQCLPQEQYPTESKLADEKKTGLNHFKINQRLPKMWSDSKFIGPSIKQLKFRWAFDLNFEKFESFWSSFRRWSLNRLRSLESFEMVSTTIFSISLPKTIFSLVLKRTKSKKKNNSAPQIVWKCVKCERKVKFYKLVSRYKSKRVFSSFSTWTQFYFDRLKRRLVMHPFDRLLMKYREEFLKHSQNKWLETRVKRRSDEIRDKKQKKLQKSRAPRSRVELRFSRSTSTKWMSLYILVRFHASITVKSLSKRDIYYGHDVKI